MVTIGRGMNKLDGLRSRYLLDPISVRLGGLAANLARVANFSKDDRLESAAYATLEESKWFIEWIAAELEMEDSAELVRLQIQMAIWQVQSPTKWNDEAWRARLTAQSRQWSEQLLQMSGLQNS